MACRPCSATGPRGFLWYTTPPRLSAMPRLPLPPTGRCGNDQSETRSTGQTMIPFIDLQAQRFRIAADIDAAIRAVLEHGQYILVPQAAALETAPAPVAADPHAPPA